MVRDMKVGDMVRMKRPGTYSWHGGVIGVYVGPAEEGEAGHNYHIFMRGGKLCWADADYVKNKLEVVNESR